MKTTIKHEFKQGQEVYIIIDKNDKLKIEKAEILEMSVMNFFGTIEKEIDIKYIIKRKDQEPEAIAEYKVLKTKEKANKRKKELEILIETLGKAKSII